MADIGFIGAGVMGSGMVRSLMRAHKSVAVVVHRRRDIIDGLIAEGAVEAASITDIVGSCPVVVTCVTDAPAVSEIAESLLPDLREGQVWIDATTSDPQVSIELAAKVEACGGIFADAPVTGGPRQAVLGELGSLVGCRREKFNLIKAVVGAYSIVVQRFGDVGSGNTAKLVNNFVTQSTGVLLAEAYDRARRAGVDWRALYDIMCVGAARSGTLEKMVGPALEGNFEGSQFSVSKARKDIEYYRRLSARIGEQPSAIADAVQGVLDAVVEAGHGQFDVSQLLEPDVLVRKKAL
ncbi:MAG: NAD(P)-dependent oxidoreductase [Hyphomicrobiaceae bacterium]